MKTGVFYLVLVAALLSACSKQVKNVAEFPLEKGTTWVYSYEVYEQGADPSQVIKATYQLTEIVVDVQSTSAGLIAHVERDFELVAADLEWTGNFSSQQEEFWYVVMDQQTYKSLRQPDGTTFNAEDLELIYEFPLTVGKSWCLFQLIKGTLGCEPVGKREVTGQSSFETQTENFNDCYDSVDYFNTGNFYQTFCNGVGVVHVKFDHPGTRFGFEQTLIDYSPGIQ